MTYMKEMHDKILDKSRIHIQHNESLKKQIVAQDTMIKDLVT